MVDKYQDAGLLDESFAALRTESFFYGIDRDFFLRMGTIIERDSHGHYHHNSIIQAFYLNYSDNSRVINNKQKDSSILGILAFYVALTLCKNVSTYGYKSPTYPSFSDKLSQSSGSAKVRLSLCSKDLV